MCGVVHTYYVWSVFMYNWCVELLRLIVSSLCSRVTDVWCCSELLCPLCVHVQLMSGLVQTCYVWSVFMCIWCLELLRLIVSSLSSCVTDVWSCSFSYTWTQRGYNKSEQLQTSDTHEHRPDITSLNNSRHQIHRKTEDTIQTSVIFLVVFCLCSCVADVWFVFYVFTCIWCLELLILIMSGLCSCVPDVWSCSGLVCPLWVHVYLMSGVAQTYYVLSEFMCNWCLEMFIFIMSGLCWTERGHNKSEQLQTSDTHEHRPDITSLNNSRHQLHMNSERT
jgi:hypothetical protein